MSVIITISDDGHVEATHNSGRILWSLKLDGTFTPYEPLDEGIAWWLDEALCSYDVGDES